jgi:hypothetical protein
VEEDSGIYEVGLGVRYGVMRVGRRYEILYVKGLVVYSEPMLIHSSVVFIQMMYKTLSASTQ